MKKVVSYRQKIIELARIYKIAKVLDINQRLTTYEIELELLRNKVPIPSRRGYFSHIIINEIFDPLYVFLKEKFEININIHKNIKSFFNTVKAKINYNYQYQQRYKKIFDGINSYFAFVISSITNFFKIITKIIIEGLNNAYHFKVNEKIINKFILRGAYASFLLVIIFGGFYIKRIYVSNLDSVKISLEIKSDKNRKEKPIIPLDTKTEESKKIVKKPEKPKKALTILTLTTI